jgi:hypothetical protein
VLNRRDAVRLLTAAPFLTAPHQDPPPEHPRESELIVCGWDEVFILALGRAGATHRKVWSWRAVDSPEIPDQMRSLFRTTDDCKPVDGGAAILISSSGGGVALVDRRTRRASFAAQVTNAHSIERLPAGRIAVAASVAKDGTGDRVVIFDASSGKPLATDALRSGHGVVWDDDRRVLWALGGDVLRAYRVSAPDGRTTLERTFEASLPTQGGHDLIAIPGSPCLFVSTSRRCYEFDRERRQFSPHDRLGDHADVKSYNVHPRTGRVVYVQAEPPNWWTEHLQFQRPDARLQLAGERLYKARWA